MSAQLKLFEMKPRPALPVRMGLAESRADAIRLACIDCGFDAGWWQREKIKFFGIDADTICAACSNVTESKDRAGRGERLKP